MEEVKTVPAKSFTLSGAAGFWGILCSMFIYVTYFMENLLLGFRVYGIVHKCKYIMEDLLLGSWVYCTVHKCKYIMEDLLLGSRVYLISAKCVYFIKALKSLKFNLFRDDFQAVLRQLRS